MSAEHHERVARALEAFEDAVALLVLTAEHPPPVERRPPRWRPLARRRHLLDHDHWLALWAEGVEDFAAEVLRTRGALEHARMLADVEDALG